MKSNKKKQLPLLLLALLLITTAAYGTKAYFTDSASQKGDVSLTLGKLAVANKTTGNWKYAIDTTVSSKNNNLKAGATAIALSASAEQEISDATDINNMQPGDVFSRIFNFENTGTLDQLVSLEMPNTVKNASTIFDIKYQIRTSGQSEFGSASTELPTDVRLLPGESIEIKVIISLTDDSTKYANQKNTDISLDFTNDMILTAKQANKK